MSSLQKSILKSKRPPSDVSFGFGSRLVYYDYYKLKMLTEILINVFVKAIQQCSNMNLIENIEVYRY